MSPRLVNSFFNESVDFVPMSPNSIGCLSLGAPKQSLEAMIHLLLDMAMKQR